MWQPFLLEYRTEDSYLKKKNDFEEEKMADGYSTKIKFDNCFKLYIENLRINCINKKPTMNNKAIKIFSNCSVLEIKGTLINA